MTEKECRKLDVACEYLDAAIEFFLAGRNLFCAIHLSAAAEELLGAHLPESERISTSAWKAERALKSETGRTLSEAQARRSVSEWKNEIKHMDDGTSPTFRIDPAYAAEHHIDQALINYYKLGLRKSPFIWKFEDHQNRGLAAIKGADA